MTESDHLLQMTRRTHMCPGADGQAIRAWSDQHDLVWI